ncbi:MAG: O-antigen ligase family protein [Solirubrobacterales bacterium]|nr:O-antigen ligase family protein [Solirubrobacterales bacterium]
MVGLTTWTAIAISWSNDAGIAYIRAIQIATALGICVLVIFVSKPGEGRSWIAGLTIGFGVIVVLAAASRFLPGIGTDAALSERLGPIIGGRLSWPLGYWNALGLITAFFLMFCLWHGGHAVTKRARTIATGFFPLAALVMYLCSSRGSIVASLIGAAIVIGLGPSRKRLAGTLAVGLVASTPLILLATQLDEVVHAGTGSSATIQGLALLLATIASCAVAIRAREPVIKRIDAANFHHRTALRVGIGLGVVALILVIASNPVDRINSFTSIPVAGANNEGSTFATEHLLSESGNGRWQLWQTSLDAFKEQPVRGIGPGGFESYFKTNGQFWMKTIDPHSIPLQFLSELGLVGFFLLLGVVGLALYAGIRRFRELGVKSTAAKVPGGREELTAFIGLLAVGMFGVSIDWTGDMPVIFVPIMVCIAAWPGLFMRLLQVRGPKVRWRCASP